MMLGSMMWGSRYRRVMSFVSRSQRPGKMKLQILLLLAALHAPFADAGQALPLNTQALEASTGAFFSPVEVYILGVLVPVEESSLARVPNQLAGGPRAIGSPDGFSKNIKESKHLRVWIKCEPLLRRKNKVSRLVSSKIINLLFQLFIFLWFPLDFPSFVLNAPCFFPLIHVLILL